MFHVDCYQCINVCPFNKRTGIGHELVRWTIRKLPFMNKVVRWGDDLFYKPMYPDRQAKLEPERARVQQYGSFPILMTDLKRLIREVPDFPKPGILFYDITTLLKDKSGFRGVIDGLKAPLPGRRRGHGAGHRGARLHLRAGPGLCAGRGLRARAQAEETARRMRERHYDLEYGTDTPGDAHGRHRSRASAC